jgi:hypothetical protein
MATEEGIFRVRKKKNNKYIISVQQVYIYIINKKCVMNIYFSFLKGKASYYIQFYFNLNKRI